MPTAAVIDDTVEPKMVINTILASSLEPNYGLHLCWTHNGYGIGDIWLSTDPDTGIGIFQHPEPPPELQE